MRVQYYAGTCNLQPITAYRPIDGISRLLTERVSDDRHQGRGAAWAPPFPCNFHCSNCDRSVASCLLHVVSFNYYRGCNRSLSFTAVETAVWRWKRRTRSVTILLLSFATISPADKFHSPCRPHARISDDGRWQWAPRLIARQHYLNGSKLDVCGYVTRTASTCLVTTTTIDIRMMMMRMMMMMMMTIIIIINLGFNAH